MFLTNAEFLKRIAGPAAGRHSGAGRNPAVTAVTWTPAFAGVTMQAAIVFVTVLSGRTLAQESRPASPEGFVGQACLSAGCHASLVERQHVHTPLKQNDCESCHRQTNEQTHEFVLTGNGADLCYECHDQDELQEMPDDSTRSATRHQPFFDGQCLACHDPHSSNHPNILRQDGRSGLCMDCHEGDVDLDGAVHAPIVQNGCLGCHQGHKSALASLLSMPYREVCSTCHEDTLHAMRDRSSVHPPAASNDCASCHDPHASRHANLLIEAYQPDAYAAVKDRQLYALCFECHDEDLMDESETDVATRFRNGTMNLHFLHVHREQKGRACRLCHDAHASDQPRLMRSETQWGDWKMRLDFIATESGGKCGPGCHSAKQYDHERPVDYGGR